MKIVKPKVKVAGIGTIDECECCNKNFTTGFACWLIDKVISINLCDDCLNNKFEVIK